MHCRAVAGNQVAASIQPIAVHPIACRQSLDTGAVQDWQGLEVEGCQCLACRQLCFVQMARGKRRMSRSASAYSARTARKRAADFVRGTKLSRWIELHRAPRTTGSPSANRLAPQGMDHVVAVDDLDALRPSA